MNIFILNTGRCGSSTFIAACMHITNYTASHESRSSIIGAERLSYPRDHIEADNRLSWLLGRLDAAYGDDAIYVHLKRSKEDTANSFTKRYHEGIIKAYRGNGIIMGASKRIQPIAVARDYCETVNHNIHMFLKDKSKKMTISLETIDEDFRTFWEYIGAEGDLEAACEELRIKHNATGQKPEKLLWSELAPKLLEKIARIMKHLPDFLKNV